jgi:hypothetical protein
VTDTPPDTPAPAHKADEAEDTPAATADAPEESAPAMAEAPPDIRRYLPWVGLVVAFWATLPKYSGPTLVTAPGKEVADHVIPGIVVGIASLVALAARKREGGPGLTTFGCACVALLAGFWMVATHVPLLAQAARGDAPWAATIYHSSAAFAVFGFGLLWTTVHWPDLTAAMEEDDRNRAPAAESG